MKVVITLDFGLHIKEYFRLLLWTKGEAIYPKTEYLVDSPFKTNMFSYIELYL